jgi:hypothetical protein
MSTHVQGWLRTTQSIVLDWLTLVMSFGTIAWISFRPIGG